MTEDRFGAALDLLDRLVGFDTVSSRSNLPLIDFMEDYLGRHGVESVRVPNKSGEKAALFATIGPAGDNGVLLSGHTDVVPTAGQSWTGDPFRLRRHDDQLYGRGTCDMKGFVAACLAVVPTFKDVDLARPIHFLFSYDEEIGCLGSLDTIAMFGRSLPRPALALVGEPTMMRVVSAHKSIATFKTVVRGKEAHSADPRLGGSAIEAACALVADLYALQAELEATGDPTQTFEPPYSTIHVGRIEGGNARNILARDCSFEWEFRGLPGIDPQFAIRRFEKTCAERVLPKLRRHAPAAVIQTEADHVVPPLVAEPGSPAEALALRLAGTGDVTTESYVTEAGQFQAVGIPTVVCGPGSIRQAHQPDEFLAESQLAAVLAFMERLAQDCAGTC